MRQTGGFPLRGTARYLLSLFCLVVGLWSSRGEAEPERPLGTVLRLVGTVQANDAVLASGCPPLRLPSGLVLRTGDDGQIWFIGPQGEEVRLRERTVLTWETASGSWKADGGLIGWRVPGTVQKPLRIRFPQGECEAQAGIVILKVHPVLTRVAAVKKSHQVIGPEKTVCTLEEKWERGIAWKETSQPYEVTNDLYFSWYW